MSDLVKAQNTPQFNWYTCWTSLGANGTPDKLIEEGLKQPVFLWGGTTRCTLIATPNVDNANRRQKKGKS
jgi:hypothetical protein